MAKDLAVVSFRENILMKNFVESCREYKRQASWSFNAAVIVSIVGIFIVLTSVIHLYSGHITLGALNTVSAIVSGIMSARLFQIYRYANNQYLEMTKLIGNTIHLS